ncbi:hypothetical protein WJX82_000978 [Trebouxia sp. C0006]
MDQLHLHRSCVLHPVPQALLPRRVRSPLCSRQAVAQQAGTETPAQTKARKSAPLARGGTLKGEKAAGKAAGSGAKAVNGADQMTLQLVDGKFRDSRWQEGRWVLDSFKDNSGSMDWDKVIDAEMARRKLLEESPIPSTQEEPVLFDTSEIPWWAWVRRFHLPEAEKINGRACMVGYALGYFVDVLTGHGLVDQQNSFLGKVLLNVTVIGLLIYRNNAALPAYKNLLDEATFYDKQWQATWEGQNRPSESEK